MSRADLLLHPIRLRIVMTMAGDELTTSQLAERLGDVPQATLYRQVATLHESGILQVVGETKNRGGIERTYRLVEEAASLGPEEAAKMTTEDHLSAVTTFVGAILEAAARYLHSEGAAPGTDVFGYRLIPLHLNDSEAVDLVSRLGEAIEPYVENDPDGRNRVLFNMVVVPDRR